MQYEKIEGTTHIYVEEGESEQQVLCAIVKASFDLARPAGLGWIQFNDSQQMTEEDAEKFVSLTPRYEKDNTVVAMDYVQGRQCKTYISKAGERHFTLSNHTYERDRGTPEPMLDRAKEILAGKQDTGSASTGHMYKGESLTLRLKEYGFARRPGESDWEFRKRVFPQLYQLDPGRAMEFLMGSSAAEWHEIDTMLCLGFMVGGDKKPTHHELVKFAEGFAVDPLQRREKLQ